MTHQNEIPFAVITGASSGIGYDLARQFAEHGFDLLVTSDNKRIEESAQRLRELGAQAETDMVARDQGHVLFTASFDDGPSCLEGRAAAPRAFRTGIGQRLNRSRP